MLRNAARLFLGKYDDQLRRQLQAVQRDYREFIGDQLPHLLQMTAEDEPECKATAIDFSAGGFFASCATSRWFKQHCNVFSPNG